LKKKILLTGATGFLGSHLLKNFILNKFEVVILKRSTSNLWRINDLCKGYTAYDIDKISVFEVFEKEKPNIIVHTACSYGRSNESIIDILKTNLFFGLEIFEAAKKNKSQVFINVDSLLPRNLNSYSLSKAQFTDWLKINKQNIDVVNLKIEHMFGPMDDNTKFLGWLTNKMLTKTKASIDLTTGVQKRDFIFIDDIVEVFNLVINNKNNLNVFTEYEVGTGNFIPVKEFIIKIARQLEDTKKIEILSRLNFGAIPYREGEIMEPLLDNTKLKRLGWVPKYSIEQGIKETLKNYL